jgi:hypothetical protein
MLRCNKRRDVASRFDDDAQVGIAGAADPTSSLDRTTTGI